MARPSLRDFDGAPMYTPLATTADCEPHTTHPVGYVARAEWFEVMAETHVQRKCRGCGRWMVWEPKGTGNDAR